MRALAFVVAFCALAACLMPKAPGQVYVDCNYQAIAQGNDCSAHSPTPSPTPTPTPTATPTPTPTPSPPVPNHVLTYGYDEYSGEGSKISPTNSNSPSPTQIQTYMSFAEAGLGNDKASVDCDPGGVPSGKCRSVFYHDVSQKYDMPPACSNPDTTEYNYYNSNGYETAFLHYIGFTDSAHRLYQQYTRTCGGTQYSYNVYDMNPGDAHVQAYTNSYLQTNMDPYHFDIQFNDDDATSIISKGEGPTGSYCRSSVHPGYGLPGSGYCWTNNQSYIQEFLNTTYVVTAWHQFYAAMETTASVFRPIIFNGITSNCNTGPEGIDNTNIFTQTDPYANNAIGAEAEGPFIDNSVYPKSVPCVLNAAFTTQQQRKYYILQDYDTYPTSSTLAAHTAARISGIGLVWLYFDQNYSVLWEDMEDNTDYLAVYPEEQIVPSQPVQSMTTGASDLQVATGVYRREFGACYYNGVNQGRCAAIVNSTTSAVSTASGWLTQTYAHEMTINNAPADILSGGTVSPTGAAYPGNGTSIPSGGALLLFQ